MNGGIFGSKHQKISILFTSISLKCLKIVSKHGTIKAPKVLIRSFLFMYVNQFFWRAVVLFFPVFFKVLIIPPPPGGGESRRNIYH